MILGEQVIDYLEIDNTKVYVFNTIGSDSYYEIEAKNMDISGKLRVDL